MTIYHRTIGSNGGKARLWLEGRILIDSGFRQGDHFDAFFNEAGELVLQTCTVQTVGHTRKVSGKNGNPIIDISGQKFLIDQAGLTIGDQLAIVCAAVGVLIIRKKA